MVRVDELRHFVIADIPGLIEGAADGAGLGTRFLKHLSRCRMLIHLVDIAPVSGEDPAEQVQALNRELARFSPVLSQLPQWLVFNKTDLVFEDEAEETIKTALKDLDWHGPLFKVSAATGNGVKALTQAIMNHFDEEQLRLDGDPEYAAQVAQFRQSLADEIRDADQEKKQARKEARRLSMLKQQDLLLDDSEDEWEEDDSDVEVIYIRD